ncbi:MAG: hypothetical protein HFJ42_07035 [Clostridia bacterium]|nr:hypothetical protein [Clostridia bacterium]
MNEKMRGILSKEMEKGELTQEHEETLIAIMKNYIKEIDNYDFCEFFRESAEWGYSKLTMELLEIISYEAVKANRKRINFAKYKYNEWKKMMEKFGTDWLEIIDDFEKNYNYAVEGAVKGNQIELVKELIEFDKNFTIKYREYFYKDGKLIRYGILKRCVYGRVKYAVENGNLEMVKLLLSVSGSIESLSIRCAIESKNENSAEMIKMLCEHNYKFVDVTWAIEFRKVIKSGDLSFARMWLESVKKLWDEYKDIYMRDAIQYGNVGVFELLREYGEIDVNRPLNYADVYKTLLEDEIKDFEEGYGHLIALAVRNAICHGRNRIPILEKLIEAGADVTVDNNYCIKKAVEDDYIRLTKILIEAGADVTVDNNYCLKIARKNGNEELANLLIVAGAKSNS